MGVAYTVNSKLDDFFLKGSMPDICELLYYGPYVASNTSGENLSYITERFRVKLNMPMYEPLKILLHAAHVMKMKQSTYQDAKKMLTTNYLQASDHKSSNSDPVSEMYIDVIRKIRTHQKENRLLENAMLSYAPIANYSQTINIPTMVITDSITSGSDNGNSDLPLIIRMLKSCNEERKLSDILLLILQKNPIYILSNIQYFVDNHVDNAHMDRIVTYFMKLLCGVNKNETDSLAASWYLGTYICNFCKEEDYSSVIDILTSLYAGTGCNADKKMNVTAVIEALMGYIDHTIEDHNNDNAIIRQKADLLMNEIANNAGDALDEKFNIDILTGYISSARRYMTNNYTNALLLNSNLSISGYSYLQDDMMICMINDDLLCTPVLDLSEDYKMKLICLDKEDNITIRTDFDF